MDAYLMKPKNVMSRWKAYTLIKRPIALTTHMIASSRALILAMCIIVTVPFQAHSHRNSSDNRHNKVTIGVLAFRPKPIAQAQWADLEKYLRQQLPDMLIDLRVLTYPELEEAIERHEIDIVISQPAHYVLMTYRNGLNSPFATLINEDQGEAIRQFGSTILSLSSRTDLRTITDLKGRTIATASTDSLGGYLMSAYELRKKGIILPQDAKVIQTGMPHDKAVDAVLDGVADVAFVRSGVLESMLKEGKVIDGQLNIINRLDLPGFPFASSSPLYPEWPVATMPHLDEQVANRIAAAFYTLPYDGDVAKSIGIHGFSVPADYHPVEELLKALRQPPFDASPEFTLADIWNKYNLIIAVSSFLCLIVIILLGLLFRGNRLLKKHQIKQKNAELALANSRKLFISTVDGLNSNIALLNKFGDILLVNRAWRDFALANGSCANTVWEGTNYLKVCDDACTALRSSDADRYVAKQMADGIRAATSGVKNEFYIEYECSSPDAKMIFSSKIQYCEYGLDTYVVVVHENITDRKQLEERLSRSERNLTAILNNIPSMIGYWDRGLINKFCNRAYEKWFGLDSDRIPGMHVKEVIGDESYSTYLPYIEAALAGEIQVFEHEIPAPDRKSTRHAMITFIPEIIANEVFGYYSMVSDVTAIKIAEKEIKSQAIHLQSVIDSAPDIIFYKNISGVYMGCNPKFSAFVGRSRKEIIGKTDYELFDKETSDYFRVHDKRAIESDTPLSNEEVITYPGGDKRQVNTIKASYRGPEGELIGVIGISRDVTELRHLEQIKEDVERITQHDLKSPLNGIINIPMMLLDDDNLTKNQRDLLELVGLGGRKMLMQINSALELYKIEAGKYHLLKNEVDPVKLAQDNINILARGLQFDRERITLQVYAAKADDYRIPIKTDGLLLDVIQMNLFRNALEASDKSAQVFVDLSSGGNELIMSISNSRPVPLEIRDRFFEKYTTAGKSGGTGLGTYSAAIMTRALGGTIEMETSEETGTKVTVKIPMNPDKLT